MEMSAFLVSPVAVAGVTAIAALVGALGSQTINARATLRSKRLELACNRKMDAYQNFLIEAARFAHEPRGEEKYREYLAALMMVELIGSHDVVQSLEGDSGVNYAIQQIRAYHDKAYFTERSAVIEGPFYEAMERLRGAMRQDLGRPSGI